jgi:glycosyltransferase involved in cell wall biosynthesis
VPVRVLQAPANIANQPWLMAQGLRELGHEVEVWEYDSSPFAYETDRSIDVSAGPAAYLRTVIEAIEAEFDVVHFHFARSLVPATGFLPWYWDLPVWRSLGVTVVFTFHGTDVRLRSHHLADDEWSFYRFGDVPCDEDRIEASMAVIRRYTGHLTVASVLDLPYVPDATYLPKTVDTQRLRPVPRSRTDRPPVVLHAPSRRATKGTDLVLAGLDALRAEGVEFEVDLVEGVRHAEAMERMSRADIVVEKLLGGDAGVTSLEAMAQGKVAIARIRDEVRRQHPDLPVVSADPSTFTSVLRDLVADPVRCAELGAAGRHYVEREHAPTVTGQRLERLYAEPSRNVTAAYPGWTVPRAEEHLERLQRQLDGTQLALLQAQHRNTELRARLKKSRHRNREIAQQLDAARTELAAMTRSRLARTLDTLRSRRQGRPE